MMRNDLRKREMFIAFAFVAYIVIFGLLTSLLGARNIGYRMLKGYKAYLPENSTIADHVEGIISECGSAFNDNFIFRERIANYTSKLSTLLTGQFTIESTQVLLGKDNWLFYKSRTDGDSIADYRGTNSFTKEELEKIKNNLVYQRKCTNRTRR